MLGPSDASRKIGAVLLLTAAVLFAFWPVLENGFLNYDDDRYVTGNRHVRQGLTPSGLSWAWTTGHAANWHPVTWISHMLDWELFGADPAGHHASSLVLHLANVLLLFLILTRMTGSVVRSAVVAALFGLHPLHVESVAWVAERKDVLSALFWMLATLAYVRYARSSSTRWYWLAVALLAVGLCAKPMLVTLPFTLFLLDYWPLGRWPAADEGRRNWRTARALIREKIPMLVIVAASSIVTLQVQSAGEAVRSLEQIPFLARSTNAIVSYVDYLGKTLWPVDLAVFYPHPGASLPTLRVAAAALLLIVTTVLVVHQRRRRPYLVVGWLWYLGTLVPVIGLVQVGLQALADRYTYIPLIGIFLIAAWGAGDALRLVREARLRAAAAGVICGLVMVALVLTTRSQVRHWRDPVTLFGHALDVTTGNPVAHNNLGLALAQRGETEEALRHYEKALSLDPGYVEAHNNLGIVLAAEGRLEEAVASYSEALRLRPDYPEAHNNLGVALAISGRADEAIRHYEKAIRIWPDYAEAYNNLGLALAGQARWDESLKQYEAALRIEPTYAKAHNNLGRALADRGRTDEAIPHYVRAVEIDPNYAEAHNNLGIALAATGRTTEAVRHYEEALRIRPDYLEALGNLGGALISLGRLDEALARLDLALRLKPDYAAAHSNRAAALYLKGEYAKAWQAIGLARESGMEPPQRLVALLSEKMPAP